MQLQYRCSKQPLVLSLDIQSEKESKVRIIAYDASRRNTKYMDRYNVFKGTNNFIIRLPQSPELLTIQITGSGNPLKIVGKDVKPLQTQMDAWDFENKHIAKFVMFSQQFSDRAGYLSVGKYLDDSGTYEISYLTEIKSDQTGKPLNTPARINSTLGTVQVSKGIFEKYTIPGRVAILLHEFCHVFANNDVHSEIEADFHAAQIYCALGYPRIEILNVFANVFYGADNDLNRLRLAKLMEFVDNFDKRVTTVKYGV
jgi:hypothetical protein